MALPRYTLQIDRQVIINIAVIHSITGFHSSRILYIMLNLFNKSSIKNRLFG